ncbi:MAG: hypothetical protein ABR584_12725, partial [Candidatus Baltobacteraceae bacterium]
SLYPGGGFTGMPLENQTVAQSASFVVTPCDVDGYPVPAGQQLANALVFQTTNPAPLLGSVGRKAASDRRTSSLGPSLTFSPNVITQGGDTTVTVTYPAGGNISSAQYVVPSPLPPGTPTYATIEMDPTHYVLATNAGDNNASLFLEDADNALNNNFVGYLATGNAPGHVAGGSPQAGSGCAFLGGQAVAVNDSSNSLSLFTIPLPSAANPAPTPSVSTIADAFAGVPATAITVSGCNAEIAEGSFVWSLFMPSSSLATSGNGPYSNPSPYDGSTQFAHGPAAVSSVANSGGNFYVGLGLDGGGYLNSLVNLANQPFSGQALITEAMAPYPYANPTKVALAYQNQSDGYLHFALFDGTTLSADASAGSNPTIKAMVADPNGNVWAIGNSNSLYEYVPASPTASVPITLLHNNPTGITLDGFGNLYVSDNGGGSGYMGTVDTYLWSYIYNPPGSVAAGHNTSSVTTFP